MQKSLRSRKYSVSICLEGQQAYDMNSAPISSPIPQHDARFRCHHRSGYRAGRHPFIPWHGRCGCAIWGNRLGLGDCCLNMFEYFPTYSQFFVLFVPHHTEFPAQLEGAGMTGWKMSRRWGDLEEHLRCLSVLCRKGSSDRSDKGLSENRVYIPNYSHLIGIMISKTIGFRGTTIFRHTHKEVALRLRICQCPEGANRCKPTLPSFFKKFSSSPL